MPADLDNVVNSIETWAAKKTEYLQKLLARQEKIRQGRGELMTQSQDRVVELVNEEISSFLA